MENNEEKLEYKSAKLLLEAIQKEYENEISKLSDLYSRTGIFIAVITVYLGYFMEKDDYFTFFRTSSVKGIGCIDNIILNILYIITLICVFISGCYFFKVLLTASYIRLDPSQGFNQTIAINPEDENAFYLMQRYTEIVLSNKPKVNRKIKYYKMGVIFLEVSMGFACLYAIYINYLGL